MNPIVWFVDGMMASSRFYKVLCNMNPQQIYLIVDVTVSERVILVVGKVHKKGFVLWSEATIIP